MYMDQPWINVMIQRTPFIRNQSPKHALDQCPKYYMKILLGDINGKEGRDVFKLTIGNYRLHETSNDNEIRGRALLYQKLQLSCIQSSHTAKFIIHLVFF
jgi:hypothetical protein